MKVPFVTSEQEYILCYMKVEPCENVRMLGKLDTKEHMSYIFQLSLCLYNDYFRDTDCCCIFFISCQHLQLPTLCPSLQSFPLLFQPHILVQN